VTTYETLLKAVQDGHVFRRNKRPLGTKVLACLLYMSGLSYRAMTYQTGIIPGSHVAVHYWVHRLEGMVSAVPRRERKIVAVDETVVKLQGRPVYVWGAIDVDTKELLAVYASYGRAFVNAEVMMKRVEEACEGDLPVILVDRGPWYPWVLDRMGFKWLHITFGLRNAIERLFRTLKERTKRFYNNVPSKYDVLKNVNAFGSLFILWYNRLRRHQGLGHAPAEVSLS
jgi:transposase-like protein